MKIRAGKKVVKGDVIGILSTGSPLSRDRLEAGVNNLKKLGFEVKIPLDPSRDYGTDANGFSNGSVAERLSALKLLLADDSVACLIAARGAYGTIELLPHLPFDALASAGKLIIGCSDITYLLNQLPARSGLCALHGITLGSALADYDKDQAAKDSVDSLFALLSGATPPPQYSGKVLSSGQAQGLSLGGNLSVLCSLLGTPWDLDYKNKILFLEEVGEAPYRVHRLFTQLGLSGKLEQVQGIALGRFSKCSAPHGPGVEEVIREVLRDTIKSRKIPIVSDLPFGHWGENQAVPIGQLVEINGERISFLELPV